jgi:GT2 family glycosyltransferase
MARQGSGVWGSSTRAETSPQAPLAEDAPGQRLTGQGGAARLLYSAVVPTKDRGRYAEDAVSRLLCQTRLPARIVVVDASEQPLTPAQRLRDAVRAAGVEVEVIHSTPSTSGQRNRGVERVDSPLVLLLDDDITLQADYAKLLLERWERSGLAAFGALVGVPLDVPRQGWLQRSLRRVSMLHYQAPGAVSTSFRRSRKLRLVSVPAREVVVPACGAGYGIFRADLLRRHPFDERFAGYAPGEDLDMSSRLSAEAPILQVPAARWTHHIGSDERTSPARWRQRGRAETYFRARHLSRSPLNVAAFLLSLVAEATIAAFYSLRHRGGHLRGYLAGVLETLREGDYRYEQPRTEPASCAPAPAGSTAKAA